MRARRVDTVSSDIAPHTYEPLTGGSQLNSTQIIGDHSLIFESQAGPGLEVPRPMKHGQHGQQEIPQDLLRIGLWLPASIWARMILPPVKNGETWHTSFAVRYGHEGNPPPCFALRHQLIFSKSLMHVTDKRDGRSATLIRSSDLLAVTI